MSSQKAITACISSLNHVAYIGYFWTRHQRQRQQQQTQRFKDPNNIRMFTSLNPHLLRQLGFLDLHASRVRTAQSRFMYGELLRDI